MKQFHPYGNPYKEVGDKRGWPIPRILNTTNEQQLKVMHK